MNQFSFINPVRSPNTNFINRLGVSANIRKTDPRVREKANKTFIEKRIDKLEKEKENLSDLLKSKEDEEIHTIQKIENERRIREQKQLELVRNDISSLKRQLNEKANLEKKIIQMFQDQKNNDLSSSLNTIKSQREKLTFELNTNINELQNLRSKEIDNKQKIEESKIKSKFEEDKVKQELLFKEQEHQKEIEKKKIETEKEINDLKLKYLHDDLSEIKKDLLFKEKQEKLLRGKDIPRDIRSNIRSTNIEVDEDIDDIKVDSSLLKKSNNSNSNIPISNINLDNIYDFIEKNKDDIRGEKREKLDSIGKLLGEIFTESNEKKIEVKNKSSLPNTKIGPNKLPMVNMFEDDPLDDPNMDNLIGKLNLVESSLNKITPNIKKPS